VSYKEALLVLVVDIAQYKVVFRNGLFKLIFHQQEQKKSVNKLYKRIEMLKVSMSFCSNARTIKGSQIKRGNTVLMPYTKVRSPVLS
jgi:hypothetical protein